MKIAMCKRNGSFSDGWSAACEKMGITVVDVDVYSPKAIDLIRACDGFMWHWHHASSKDWLFARQLIASCNLAHIPTFPDIKTCWNFDDKIGQSYLLTLLGLPAVRSWTFYQKEAILEWIRDASFPMVFKLRSGAGATNVRLVHNQMQARHLARKMFGRGIPAVTMFGDITTTVRQSRKKGQFLSKLLKAPKSFLKLLSLKVQLPRQKGYVYFQEFIPRNAYDKRIVVIGNKAIGIRRYCRPNDSRASGSGELSYEKRLLPEECVRIAFEASRKMQIQCGAFDFVYDDRCGKYLIVEVSYGFTPQAYGKCEGYWSSDMIWHDEKVEPERWMVEELVCQIEKVRTR